MPDKLEEELREVCIDWTGEPIVDDSTPRYEVHCGLLREAADEITRLKGEMERQAWEIKAHKATLAGTEVRAEQAETALAAKQALIDELVEGLDRFTRVCDDEERREAFNHAVALISKARSSGKAGSDA